MNQKTKKALNIVSYVLIGLIFVIGLIVLLYSVSVQSAKGRQLPKFLGVSVVSVKSDSMKKTAASDPDFSKIHFKKGDIITIRQLKTPAEKKDLEIGEVVTFYDARVDGLNTHVVVASQTTYPDGVKTVIYTTRGIGLDVDGKQIPQDATGNDINPVSSADVVGVYKGKMAGMGKVLDFFKGQLGFGLIIVLPLFAFLAYRVYVVVKLLMAIKKEKNGETALSEVEQMQAEIERLKAQLGAETKTESANNGTAEP